MQNNIERWLRKPALVRSFIFIAVFISLLLISLPFWPISEEELPSLFIFGGRLHPLVIHFPIVLFFVLLLWESLIRVGWVEKQKEFQLLLLFISVIFSLISVMIGFLLFQTGGYGGDTAQTHFNAGISVAIASFVCLLVFWKDQVQHKVLFSNIYFAALIFTNGLIVYTSHQGGSLTHGETFLTEHFPFKPSPEENLVQTPISEMMVFEDIIQASLESRCYTCHNENKTKGDYLMTEWDGLIKGGKSGKTAIQAGSLLESELVNRISLEESHDDHMPPEGKTPLTVEEIKLLSLWIEKGAMQNMKLADIQDDTTFFALAYTHAQDIQQELNYQAQKSLELDGIMQLVAHHEKSFVLEKEQNIYEGLALSMQFPPSGFGDNQLADLQPTFAHISKASFNSSDISDDALYHIGQMKKLKSLYLQQTNIKGSGLIFLQQLPSLEVLDLSGSAVEDAGLLHVLKIKSLKHIYLYETGIDPKIANAIAKNNPELEVHLERGNMF